MNARKLAVWSLSLAAQLAGGCRSDGGETKQRNDGPNTGVGAGSSVGGGSTDGSGGGDPATGAGGASGAGAARAAPDASADASADAVPTVSDASKDAGDAAAPDGVPSRPGARLDGFTIVMPCPPSASPERFCVPGEHITKQTHVLDFGGERGVLYDTTLHFCGVVDAKAYDGCTAGSGPLFCIDGAPSLRGSDPTRVTWKMEVDDPLHLYFPNHSLSRTDTISIDHSITVPIRGGSRVTFSTDSSYFKMSANVDAVSCAAGPAGPKLPQPYHGQFMQVTVESALPVRR